LSSIPLPSNCSPVLIIQRILLLAESHGIITSFKAIVAEKALTSLVKRLLQECGAEIEEIVMSATGNVGTFVLTRLLGLALNYSRAFITPTSGPRPVLLLLSNNTDLATSLSIIRRSGLFAEVIIVYGRAQDCAGQSNSNLIHSATLALDFYQWLETLNIPTTPSVLTLDVPPHHSSRSNSHEEELLSARRRHDANRLASPITMDFGSSKYNQTPSGRYQTPAPVSSPFSASAPVSIDSGIMHEAERIQIRKRASIMAFERILAFCQQGKLAFCRALLFQQRY